MQLPFLFALFTMIVLGFLGSFIEQPKTDEEAAAATKEEKIESIAVRWDGPKQMFCESQVFRVGSQRVCLLVDKQY